MIKYIIIFFIGYLYNAFLTKGKITDLYNEIFEKDKEIITLKNQLKEILYDENINEMEEKFNKLLQENERHYTI